MLCNFVRRQWSQFQVLFKRCNIRHLSRPLISPLSTPYLRNLMSKLVGLIKGSPFVFVFVSFSQWSACVVCPMPGRLISASLARTQSVHCTLYTVHICAVCSVHCTLCSVQCALHSALHSVQQAAPPPPAHCGKPQQSEIMLVGDVGSKENQPNIILPKEIAASRQFHR